MIHPSKDVSCNRLLAALPVSHRASLLAQCITVPLNFGKILAEKSQRIRYIYFPLTGFASLIIVINNHKPLELNMIGNEGMLGAEILLDRRIAAYTCTVQGTGSALRLSVPAFVRQLDVSPALRRICLRYCYVLMEQLAQSIACNCFHEVPQRLARWLLMTHDRADSDKLQLTHAFLASMLGVRRSAVTIAAGQLQEQRLISYVRGRISVLSRIGLEDVACECYAAGVKAYDEGLLQTA